ncbi:LacI family transcriptional regulator [Opitutaceae bacterium TAV4]|nr:LacI family transcriptional regulator [Opitutaceae bacterium TAV4]RRJ99036.1 LacI family transcriptional regulator [Opitutaceae bacterium TAV3]
MPPRVTVRQIAGKAGVHYTTVGRALRNHPGLPAATRERIQALAREMGYTPDPMVSALSAYRMARQRVTFHGTIAWIDGYPQREGVPPKQPMVHGRLFAGAQVRAREMGYNLEVYRIDPDGETPTAAALDRVLVARGVRNLIVAPQFSAASRLELDWRRYSALAVSRSVGWPQLHLVTNDHFYNVTMAARQLWRLGYRRVGLMLERRLVEITGERWLGAFLTARQYWPEGERLEPFVFENPVPDVLLRNWWERWRPDAIITEKGFWKNRLSVALELRCPDDVGVALVSTPWPSQGQEEGGGGRAKFAGILERVDRIGATAVEQLVRMEHMDERGLPESPLNTLVRGEWQDGESVKQPGLF